MYYVMRSALRDDSALIGSFPRLPIDVSWFGGRRIAQPVPAPLVFRILEDSGPWMSAFFSAGIPLMRNDLIAALEAAGVTNLDCYSARIEDPNTGNTYVDYRAVNVIGAVAAADLEQSQFDPDNPSRLIDADFDSLAVNEVKAGGFLLFRLAESVSAILAHERVREHVEPLQLPGVAFVRPEAWIG